MRAPCSICQLHIVAVRTFLSTLMVVCSIGFPHSFTTPESNGPVTRCSRQKDWGSQVEDDEMRRGVHRDMQR